MFEDISVLVGLVPAWIHTSITKLTILQLIQSISGAVYEILLLFVRLGEWTLGCFFSGFEERRYIKGYSLFSIIVRVKEDIHV